MSTVNFSHKALCDLAVKWLKRSNSQNGPGCQVAFSESRGAFDGEIPDAIGFRANIFNACSVLVEVKTSRADFLADQKKAQRQKPESGMGVYRYYFAPEGLIKAEELPKGWGLIEVNSRGHIKAKLGHVFLKHKEEDVWINERSLGHEWTLLACVLNRVGDIEQVNRWLKDSRNQLASALKANERIKKEYNQLAAKHLQLKNELDGTRVNSKATPRVSCQNLETTT